MLPERIKWLDVSIGNADNSGQLIRTSTYEFRNSQPEPEQPSVALLMLPCAKRAWQDGDLFAPMDQNLPEGDLCCCFALPCVCTVCGFAPGHN